MLGCIVKLPHVREQDAITWHWNDFIRFRQVLETMSVSLRTLLAPFELSLHCTANRFLKNTRWTRVNSC